MSYQNAAKAAMAYREREVMTASPARLVVIVYDHVISNLHRARAAAQAENLPARLEALTHARDGVMHLLSTLDVSKGGSLASNLRSLYGFMYKELVDEARHPDAHRLAKLTTMATDLREAFAALAADAAKVPAA
jgi:flagellar protein FliS